jgi:hypothetical protein
MPGHDPVARDDLVFHPEITAPVRDQLVEFFEGPRIEEQVDALARRQLAGVLLPTETVLTAAEFSQPLEFGQPISR